MHKIARSLVLVYGMSDRLPNINYNDSTGQDYVSQSLILTKRRK